MKARYILLLSLIVFSIQNKQTCKSEIKSYYMRKTGNNKIAVAGLMGNLYDECRYSSIDLESHDEEYDKYFTNKINDKVRNGKDGLQTLIDKEKYGYGLAQWTTHGRKTRLYEYAKSYWSDKKYFDIGDCGMQVRFLWKELKERYSSVYEKWIKAKTLRDSTEIIMMGYEEPYDKSEKHIKLRVSYAETAYKDLQRRFEN